MKLATTATPRRSRLVRATATAFAVLSVAGFALVGGGTSASAATAPAAAPAADTVEQAQSARQVRFFCLGIEGVRGARSARCGTRVMVAVPGAIDTVRLAARESLCVSARGIRGDRDRECRRRGGQVEAEVRGSVGEVTLSIDDTRLCGRARSDRRWSRTQCSDRRGGLELDAPGRGAIDGLYVWIVRRGR